MRSNHPQQVPNYISKKWRLYTGGCYHDETEVKEDTADMRKNRKLVGLYDRKQQVCAKSGVSRYERGLEVKKPWQLPPNIYDTLKDPFEGHKGLGGAYWSKLPKAKTTVASVKEERRAKGVWRFYDVCPVFLDRLNRPCNRYKGVFVSNARDRRATSRCMVNSPITCYHDPHHPGPSYYCSFLHSLAYNLADVQYTVPDNPHIFLRDSCVPAKRNSIHGRHIGFLPGPGRYDIRYPRVCACKANKIYMPQLQLLIDREKRLKFRRQPYTKIKARLYCCPDWKHVPGHGHRHLFKRKRIEHKKKAPTTFKETKKAVQLYADAKYLGMIDHPNRVNISLRSEPMPTLPIKIRYNCISKAVIRRQLRNNKKIVFNSGQERFPELDWRPAILTVSALEKLKAKLKPDRQLRDYPVMTKTPSQIMGKLYDTPAHMKPSYELALRKRLFKFLPLPPPKVLVTEKDTRPEMADGRPYVPQGYFGKEIDVQKYFKTDIQQRRSVEPPTDPIDQNV